MIDRTDLEKCKQVVLSYLDIKPVVTERDEKGKPLYADHPLLHSLREWYRFDYFDSVIGDVEKKENWEKFKEYIKYRVDKAEELLILYDIVQEKYKWTYIYDIKDYISIFAFNDILDRVCHYKYMKTLEKVNIVMREFKHDVLHCKRLTGIKKTRFFRKDRYDNICGAEVYNEYGVRHLFTEMNYKYMENILRNIDYVYRIDQCDENDIEMLWYTDVTKLLHDTYTVGHKQIVYKLKLDLDAVLFAWLDKGIVFMDLDYIRNTEKETFYVKQEDELWTPENFIRSRK